MEYLGLEHLSPHRAEQFFGQFRTHFTGNYDARYAFHFAICAAISLEFQSHFGIFFFTVLKRENYGGAHFNFINSIGNKYDNYSIHNLESFSIRAIAINFFFSVVSRMTLLTGSTKNFLSELNYFFANYQSYLDKKTSQTKGSKKSLFKTFNNGNKTTIFLNSFYDFIKNDNHYIFFFIIIKKKYKDN